MRLVALHIESEVGVLAQLEHRRLSKDYEHEFPEILNNLKENCPKASVFHRSPYVVQLKKTLDLDLSKNAQLKDSRLLRKKCGLFVRRRSLLGTQTKIWTG